VYLPIGLTEAIGQGRLVLLGVAAALIMAGAAVIVVLAARWAAGIRAEETVVDRFAAAVFGAAVTRFDLDRWASTSRSRVGRRRVLPAPWATYPTSAQRYMATNDALRAVPEQSSRPVDTART